MKFCIPLKYLYTVSVNNILIWGSVSNVRSARTIYGRKVEEARIPILSLAVERRTVLNLKRSSNEASKFKSER